MEGLSLNIYEAEEGLKVDMLMNYGNYIDSQGRTRSHFGEHSITVKSQSRAYAKRKALAFVKKYF